MKLISDMHTHTCASTHAYSTISENAKSAKESGIKFLGMTDHGSAMPDSPHPWHFISMLNIPRLIDGVYIIRGMESNIMDFKGSIDLEEDEIYDSLDWLVASFHRQCCEPGKKTQITQSYINVLENKKVFALAHTESTDFDYDEYEVAKACKHNNKLIELNNSRLRSRCAVSRYKQILTACGENECSIIVNSDAHFHMAVGQFDSAFSLLNEIGFPEKLVINADEQRFKDYIENFCKIDLSR